MSVLLDRLGRRTWRAVGGPTWDGVLDALADDIELPLERERVGRRQLPLAAKTWRMTGSPDFA